jgi:hypothetical protein
MGSVKMRVLVLVDGLHTHDLLESLARRDQPPVGPKSLGPTARFVSDHSPCPVLLLREGA